MRLFFGAGPASTESSKIARSSLSKDAICSLITTARFSWLMLKLCISIAPVIFKTRQEINTDDADAHSIGTRPHPVDELREPSDRLRSAS